MDNYLSQFREFSFNSSFWIKFNPGFINFRIEGMPKDIHYTFSYNENSKDVNLHLSRNVGNPEHKPRLYIFTIEKELGKRLIYLFCWEAFNYFLEPIRINKFNKKASFLSFSKMENDDFIVLLENRIAEGFKEMISYPRKKKFKIKGNIGNRLRDIFGCRIIAKRIKKSIRTFNANKVPHLDCGFLSYGCDSHVIIKINDRFYKMRAKRNPSALIEKLLTEKLFNRVKFYTKKSIFILKDSTCASDVAKYNNPIVLKNDTNAI